MGKPPVNQAAKREDKMTKTKKILKGLLTAGIIAAVILIALALIINFKVKSDVKDNIVWSFGEDLLINEEALEDLKAYEADCILVLGAGITDKNTPSPMLKDRLDAGIKLYQEGVSSKILLSGDNGQVGHNEIHVMLNYVKNEGIPEEDIFCDHAGFSTYDSMYRASSIFQVKKAVVVTQEYHEYRALYIGEKLGLDVKGVSADQEKYAGQTAREIREILARDKDFFKLKTDAESLLAGETIPISGSGVVSHGE